MELVSVCRNKDNKLYNVYVKNCNDILTMMDDILNETSYYLEGDYLVYDYDQEDLKSFFDCQRENVVMPYLHTSYMSIDSPLYKNITEMEILNNGIQIHAKKLIGPKLIDIIDNLLGQENGLQDYLDYENDEELISIDSRIAELKKEASKLTLNGQLEELVNRLFLLNFMQEKRENKECFNTILLNKYYDMIGDMFFICELDEEDESEIGELISINDYKKNKKQIKILRKKI